MTNESVSPPTVFYSVVFDFVPTAAAAAADCSHIFKKSHMEIKVFPGPPCFNMSWALVPAAAAAAAITATVCVR